MIYFFKASLVVFLSLSSCVYGQNKVSRGGVIRGVITSTNDNKPVSQVIVTVINDSVLARSDSKGEFIIKNAKLGYNSLYITAEEYKPLITESFLVSVSAKQKIEIKIEPSLIKLENVVVNAQSFSTTKESPVSMRRIGTEEIEMTPGANRDVSKVVQSAPGVISTSIQRNDILVRGGGANENKYFLDGIEIPVINHFAVQGGSGGNASLVNTDMLQAVNFYTGAFPANLSNGLSSIMDMRMARGNNEQFKAKLTLGASDVGASLDTPLTKGGKTTILASYRRSYLQMLFSVLGLPFLPTYNDYQVKVSTLLDSSKELYFIGLGSFDNNRLNTSLDAPDESQRYILGYLPENKQNSYVIGAGFRHSFANGHYRIVISRNHFSNLLYKYKDNNTNLDKTLNYNTKQADNRLRFEIDNRFQSGIRISAGAGASSGSYRNTTFRAALINNSAQSDNYSSDIDIIRYEFFATISKEFFDNKLAILMGLRGDGSDYNSEMENPFNQFSPRISVSYTINRKWTISGSIAKYFQEPPYTTMGYRDKKGVLVNKESGLKYISATHYVAGLEFRPNTSSKFSVEGFLKKYNNYPISLIDSLPVSTGDFADYSIGDLPVRSSGKGEAYGAEFSYRNLNLKNTVINLSYTFLFSKFNKLDDKLQPRKNSYNPSSWDVRNILNLSAIHKFSRNWVLGAKWYIIGGFPYTPYDLELSSRIDAWDSRSRPYIDYTLYNSKKGKTYHQLDMRVDKTWYFKSCRAGIYIDIQNLYNFSAEGQDLLMPETDATGGYINDPAKPGHYKMKSIKHNVGGTILPTLGIVLEF